MKAGILTFHNAVNYGAVLQAYALQQTISAMGADCKIVNYKSPAVERQYRKISFGERRSLKEYLSHNTTCSLRKAKVKAFSKFSAENLRLTQPITSLDELSGFDAVFVGSDQVWNPLCTNGDSAYLLKSLPDGVKKLAYAASIGKNENIDLYKTTFGTEYENLLREFMWISLREADAAKYISDKTGQVCDCVLDPTFLYGADKWRRFCTASGDEDYIFVYNLGNFSSLFQIAEKVRKQTGLKVKVINKDVKGELMSLKYKSCSCVSPDEFISLLANSRYVVTDSFHATAFSIMFHKDFYSVANTNAQNTNSRLKNVLKNLGIEERYVTDVSNFSMSKEISYKETDERLNRLQSYSLEKLSDIIKSIQTVR